MCYVSWQRLMDVRRSQIKCSREVEDVPRSLPVHWKIAKNASHQFIEFFKILTGLVQQVAA